MQILFMDKSRCIGVADVMAPGLLDASLPDSLCAPVIITLPGCDKIK